jgi:Rrf2 family nitric oxide-sensitive transcriptional repressor
MTNILKISEAASLALHTAVLLAADSSKLISTKNLASTLHASEAHLSKVLQRLEKSGIVESTRGPKGGFRLRKSGDEITLLDVYEAIDGKLSSGNCLLGERICNGNCIMGKLLCDLKRQVKDYLVQTKLITLTSVYRSKKN